MREIKFRGKRIDNGEWVYGYYGTNGSGWHWIFVPISENDVHSFKFVRVIPETVGQYTSLKDRSGKEVFEGDIIEYGSVSFKRFKVVEFYSSQSTYSSADGYSVELNSGFSLSLTFAKANEYSVVGNIYENPELLTKRN